MKRSALFRALGSVSLMLLLCGCAKESPLSTPLPIPNSLLLPCTAPPYWVKNYGDYPAYVVELLAVIEQCNGQLQGIRKIEESRTTR
ncbi:Rz1-like lysis system protein LysC [Leminorella grimontii]|uniref:Rz1-like lysis system protein LysC n=1 Tax=Leminorella grimontii TaxID=82981 RepID=UPI00403A22AE